MPWVQVLVLLNMQSWANLSPLSFNVRICQRAEGVHSHATNWLFGLRLGLWGFEGNQPRWETERTVCTLITQTFWSHLVVQGSLGAPILWRGPSPEWQQASDTISSPSVNLPKLSDSPIKPAAFIKRAAGIWHLDSKWSNKTRWQI